MTIFTFRLERCGWAANAMVAFVLGGLSSPPLAGQVPSREYDVKAAFLFNFATFVEWPPEAFAHPDSPFVIGVLGPDPFGPVLDEIVAGERVRGRPIVIKRFSRPDGVAACHVLFISTFERRHLPEILGACRSLPILLVGDMPGFAAAGGSIGFVTASRVRLEVNPAALRSAGLAMSSKLLRLADIVANDPPP